MWFFDYFTYLVLLFAVLVATSVAVAIMRGDKWYFSISLWMALLGTLGFVGVSLLGYPVIAQFVPWIAFGFAVVDDLLPWILPDQFGWESGEDRNIRISHENAVQYTDTVIPFPRKEVS